MDISETYIKMADTPEIQLDHTWVEGDCCVFRRDFQSSPYLIFEGQVVLYAYGGIDDVIDKEGGIFLPRQDQLQEMVSDQLNMLLHFGYFVFSVDGGRHLHIKRTVGEPDPTMEQLWLAFVQKENHNKVWDGEEWKNEKSLSKV